MKINTETAQHKSIITARMGSCWCGDCFAVVYPDGSIQYQGEESWQQSERRPFMGEDEPLRSYDSRLKVADYEEAMAYFVDNSK